MYAATADAKRLGKHRVDVQRGNISALFPKASVAFVLTCRPRRSDRNDAVSNGDGFDGTAALCVGDDTFDNTANEVAPLQHVFPRNSFSGHFTHPLRL